MATTDPNKIDSIFRAFLHEPTELDILKLIKKDPNALGVDFTLHAFKNMPSKSDPNYKPVLLSMKAMRLLDDKLIVQNTGSTKGGYKLTKEGEEYLRMSDPKWAYLSAKYSFMAVKVGIAAIVIAVLAWLFPKQNTTTLTAPPVSYKSLGESVSQKNSTNPVGLSFDTQKTKSNRVDTLIKKTGER